MKRLIIQFLIAMTIVSVLYTLYLKSRREKIARLNSIISHTGSAASNSENSSPEVSLSPQELLTAAKENVESLQTGMNDRYKQALTALDLGSEPPPPTLMSEEMKKKKERVWKPSGGDGPINKLLDNVKATAAAYEQSAVKRCEQAHSTGSEPGKSSGGK